MTIMADYKVSCATCEQWTPGRINERFTAVVRGGMCDLSDCYTEQDESCFFWTPDDFYDVERTQ